MADNKKNTTIIFLGIAAIAAFFFFRKKGTAKGKTGDAKLEENKDTASTEGGSGGGGGGGSSIAETSPIIERMATVPVTINTSTTTAPTTSMTSTPIGRTQPSGAGISNRAQTVSIGRRTPSPPPPSVINPLARKTSKFSGFMSMDAESGDMLGNL